MVLVLSHWDDHQVNMFWLDLIYSTDQPESQPSVKRESCSTSSGVSSDVESQHPDSSVTFSDIILDPIDST
jgi:cellulose 1,4-beta-cellobiosidase